MSELKFEVVKAAKVEDRASGMGRRGARKYAGVAEAFSKIAAGESIRVTVPLKFEGKAHRFRNSMWQRVRKELKALGISWEYKAQCFVLRDGKSLELHRPKEAK